MSFRPQFSLRVLLFVMAMVCLAAATVGEPPAPQTLMANGQAMLRILLCVMFPALLLTGTLQSRGYSRSFFIGGLFAALAAAAIACLEVYDDLAMASEDTLPSQLAEIWLRLPQFRWMFAIVWLFIPVTGLACVLFHRLLRLGEELSRPRFALRLALLIVAGLCVVAGMVGRPSGEYLLVNNVRAIVRIAMFIVFPAALVTGAVQSHGYFRVFCLGCLFPSLVGFFCMAAIASAETLVPVSLLNWSPRSPREWLDSHEVERYLVIGMLGMAPLFGLACVACRWLFQGKRAKG